MYYKGDGFIGLLWCNIIGTYILYLNLNKTYNALKLRNENHSLLFEYSEELATSEFWKSDNDINDYDYPTKGKSLVYCFDIDNIQKIHTKTNYILVNKLTKI